MNRRSIASVLGVLAIGLVALLALPRPAQAAPSTVVLTVEGMTCASCNVAVRMALERLDGVESATVSRPEKRAVVRYDPAKVTPGQMVDAVNKLGYQASVASAKST